MTNVYIYLQALSTLVEVKIHLGHFRQDRVRMAVANPPPNTIEVIKTEEKGTDVNLASHLLLDAFKRVCDAQVIITNDSDFLEPINLARRELGMKVGIVNPLPFNKKSPRLQGDFFKQIRPTALKRSQLPEKVVGRKGVILTRPTEWR